MSKDHHNDGPSFSKKPPLKKRKPVPAPSPARKEAEQDQAKRDAAKSRSFHKNINEKGLYEMLREENPDLNWKPAAKNKIVRRV